MPNLPLGLFHALRATIFGILRSFPGKHGPPTFAFAVVAEDSQHILANSPVATEVKKDVFTIRMAEFSTSPTIPLAK